MIQKNYIKKRNKESKEKAREEADAKEKETGTRPQRLIINSNEPTDAEKKFLENSDIIKKFSDTQQKDFTKELSQNLGDNYTSDRDKTRSAVKSIVKGRNRIKTILATSAAAIAGAPVMALGAVTTVVGAALTVAALPITATIGGMAAGMSQSGTEAGYAFLAAVGLPLSLGATPLSIGAGPAIATFALLHKSDEQIEKETDRIMDTVYQDKRVNDKTIKFCNKLYEKWYGEDRNIGKLNSRKGHIEAAKKLGRKTEKSSDDKTEKLSNQEIQEDIKAKVATVKAKIEEKERLKAEAKKEKEKAKAEKERIKKEKKEEQERIEKEKKEEQERQREQRDKKINKRCREQEAKLYGPVEEITAKMNTETKKRATQPIDTKPDSKKINRNSKRSSEKRKSSLKF